MTNPALASSSCTCRSAFPEVDGIAGRQAGRVQEARELIVNVGRLAPGAGAEGVHRAVALLVGVGRLL